MKQKGEIMELPDEIFIVVTEFDGNEPVPLALETFLDERCSKAQAIQKARSLGNRYGKLKIGRLIFDQEETFDKSDVESPDDKFIVVTEFDISEKYPYLRMCPIAWETFLDERCSKKEAIKRSRDIGNLYGETKIGQLVFDLDETIDLSDVTKSEENLEPIWA
jgi:hypothetical protein